MTVGTRFELGMSWVIPTVLKLRDSRPQWHINVVFGSGPEILERLEAGRVDGVVTSAPTARAQWTAQPLHPEHYVLVGASSYLDDEPLDRPEDASRHRLIDVDASLCHRSARPRSH